MRKCKVLDPERKVILINVLLLLKMAAQFALKNKLLKRYKLVACQIKESLRNFPFVPNKRNNVCSFHSAASPCHLYSLCDWRASRIAPLLGRSEDFHPGRTGMFWIVFLMARTEIFA